MSHQSEWPTIFHAWLHFKRNIIFPKHSFEDGDVNCVFDDSSPFEVEEGRRYATITLLEPTVAGSSPRSSYDIAINVYNPVNDSSTEDVRSSLLASSNGTFVIQLEYLLPKTRFYFVEMCVTNSSGLTQCPCEYKVFVVGEFQVYPLFDGN